MNINHTTTVFLVTAIWLLIPLIFVCKYYYAKKMVFLKSRSEIEKSIVTAIPEMMRVFGNNELPKYAIVNGEKMEACPICLCDQEINSDCTTCSGTGYLKIKKEI